jgi:hypothetical protein
MILIGSARIDFFSKTISIFYDTTSEICTQFSESASRLLRTHAQHQAYSCHPEHAAHDRALSNVCNLTSCQLEHHHT